MSRYLRLDGEGLSGRFHNEKKENLTLGKNVLDKMCKEVYTKYTTFSHFVIRKETSMLIGQLNKNELIEKMADNLPMLRTKLGFTQEEIAEMIGVSRHTVISMENKKRPMTWNTFLSLILIFSGNADTKML